LDYERYKDLRCGFDFSHICNNPTEKQRKFKGVRGDLTVFIDPFVRDREHKEYFSIHGGAFKQLYPCGEIRSLIVKDLGHWFGLLCHVGNVQRKRGKFRSLLRGVFRQGRDPCLRSAVVP
jgi:hypothetical protein